MNNKTLLEILVEYEHALKMKENKIPDVPPVQTVWNGEGLPPVGSKVEFYINKWLEYRESIPKSGTIVDVVAHYGNSAVCCWVGDDGLNFSETFTEKTLRPIRTPEQIEAERRERIISRMKTEYNYGERYLAQGGIATIYEAMRNGKIEGVKIDE